MAEQKPPIHLSADTLSSLGISTGHMIARLESLLQEGASAWAAPKAAIATEDGRYMMATLAAADDPKLLAVKALVVNPRNSERDLPSINGTIILLDSDTGCPIATLDGNWITAMRTACASAIAARRLADPEADSIAFIGCGVQAHSHLKVFAELFPLQAVHAFGRGAGNRDALCAAAHHIGLSATASKTARAAVANADLIVSSVSISFAATPFLDANWLRPGAFAAITDLALPWIADSMDAFDCIVIDDAAQEAAMKKPMVHPDLVQGDIRGLVQHTFARPASPTARSACVLRAVAMGDLALASLAWEAASGSNTGRSPYRHL